MDGEVVQLNASLKALLQTTIKEEQNFQETVYHAGVAVPNTLLCIVGIHGHQCGASRNNFCTCFHAWNSCAYMGLFCLELKTQAQVAPMQHNSVSFFLMREH